MSIKNYQWLLLFNSVLLSLHALADNTLDAGAIQRQTERDLQIQITPPKVKPATPTPAREVTADATTVVVQKFIFEGNHLVSTSALEASVQSFLNRPLTFTELQLAAEAAANFYRESGWIVRSYLPRQEIDAGTVVIHIVEAKFGSTRIEGPAPNRIEASRLIAIANNIQTQGKSVNAKKIDQVLLILDDLPGVSVSGNFAEGLKDGETDLVLRVADESAFSANSFIDRNGSLSTGRARAGLNLTLNSPMRLGDALATNLMKSEGSQYVRSAYSLPVGLYGTRAGVHGSYMDYTLLGSFASSGSAGSAYTIGLDFMHPLLRTQSENLSLALSYDVKAFDNRSASAVISDYSVHVTTVSLNGNRYDNLGSGGITSMTLSVSRGYVNLDGSPNQSTDASSVKTAGDYTKFNLMAGREQAITRDTALYLQLGAQQTNKNLDSSEKIFLGGASGIRAFPNAEGGGSVGQTATLELRQQLDPKWKVTSFYDYGRVQVLKTSTNFDALSGYGITMNWQAPLNFDAQLTIARRHHANPFSTSGLDGDGTLILNRIWFSVSKVF